MARNDRSLKSGYGWTSVCISVKTHARIKQLAARMSKKMGRKVSMREYVDRMIDQLWKKGTNG